MHLRIRFKFAFIVVGLSSLAMLSRGQEASQKPASELYTKAVHGRKIAQPTQRPVSPATGAKNLPSEQRNITAPKSKTGQPVNTVQRKLSDQEGKNNLRSNANIPTQQPNRVRRVIKPSVPPAEAER